MRQIDATDLNFILYTDTCLDIYVSVCQPSDLTKHRHVTHIHVYIMRTIIKEAIPLTKDFSFVELLVTRTQRETW